MATSLPQDDALLRELEELRKILNRLERQNEAHLTVNHNGVVSRSHSYLLEPVEEEDEEERSSLRSRVEAISDSDSNSEELIGCADFLWLLLQHMMAESKVALIIAAVAVKKLSRAGCRNVAPKRIIREYKLKRLRKQWRAEIQQSLPIQRRQPRTPENEQTTHAPEPSEPVPEEPKHSGNAICAGAEASLHSNDSEVTLDEDEEKEILELLLEMSAEAEPEPNQA